MKKVTIEVEDFLYDFYKKVGGRTGLTVEQAINDALFRFVRESSQKAAGTKKAQGQL